MKPAPLDRLNTLLHKVEEDFCEYSSDALYHSDNRIKQQFDKLCHTVREFMGVIDLLRKNK